MYRKDHCGAWIVWDKYGISDRIYGWEIDHIYPHARLEEQGFSTDLIDDIHYLLRPMQHQNNSSFMATKLYASVQAWQEIEGMVALVS